jgi:L-alanine-DL-glutamate epimerase-like enolase superfamily enzyme
LSSVIARVEAVDVRVPLPQPLQLGTMRIAERGYAVVSVTTDDGLSGHAIALNRDTPVAAAVNGVLARAIVGTPADRIGEAWERMFASTIAAGRVGTVLRGLSLIDIALWDVKGKRAGLPVWSLLGGARETVGVAIVGGYPRADLRPEEIGERVAAYSRDGYDVVKIARASDNAVTRRILHTARDGIRSSTRLVVDAAWVHRTPEAVLREVAEWGDVPIAWLEDPMPPENVEACARLARRAPVPIGYGDEITDEHLMTRLMQAEALGVVRVDATTVGGISGAVRVVGAAVQAGLPVSCHAYPEIHVHLGLGLRGAIEIETFDPEGNPFEPLSTLMVGGPAIAGGQATAPEGPGLGYVLDEERIARYRVDAA